MRKCWLISLILMGTLGLLLAACAPQPSPNPSTPATSKPVTATPASNIPPPTSQDAAWDKIVQAAKKEGKVDVYSYNMTGDVGIAVSKAFAQKYGIKLEIITGGGAALAERINTEKRVGAVVADIMDANTFQIAYIKEIGATATSEDIPAIKETGVWQIEPWTNDPLKHVLVHSLIYRANLINTNVLKTADEPKSLKELTQTKWKGRMVQNTPRISSGPSIFFGTMIQRKLTDPDTVRDIGKGSEFTSTDDEGAKLLIQGRYALWPGIGGRVVSPFLVQEPNLPIKFVAIEEGTVASGNAMAAINNGPHPNAAKLLINWLLTPEGQTVFNKPQGIVPVRKDVPDFTPPALRFTPTRIVIPTLDEERENTRLFRESWLPKLWEK